MAVLAGPYAQRLCRRSYVVSKRPGDRKCRGSTGPWDRLGSWGVLGEAHLRPFSVVSGTLVVCLEHETNGFQAFVGRERLFKNGDHPAILHGF